MTQLELDNTRLELSVKAKNGIDFITAATVVWIIISIIWTLSYTTYSKSVLTFMVGGTMLPLAFGLSKVYKTQWKIKNNPLDPLGLVLNLAQLFYFPFLILCLIKFPDYFILTYAIITGAHFFPYAWFYKEKVYGLFAGLISFGSLVLALSLDTSDIFYIPVYTATCLSIMGALLFRSARQRHLKMKKS